MISPPPFSFQQPKNAFPPFSVSQAGGREETSLKPFLPSCCPGLVCLHSKSLILGPCQSLRPLVCWAKKMRCSLAISVFLGRLHQKKEILPHTVLRVLPCCRCKQNMNSPEMHSRSKKNFPLSLRKSPPHTAPFRSATLLAGIVKVGGLRVTPPAVFSVKSELKSLNGFYVSCVFLLLARTLFLLHVGLAPPCYLLIIPKYFCVLKSLPPRSSLHMITFSSLYPAPYSPLCSPPSPRRSEGM